MAGASSTRASPSRRTGDGEARRRPSWATRASRRRSDGRRLVRSVPVPSVVGRAGRRRRGAARPPNAGRAPRRRAAPRPPSVSCEASAHDADLQGHHADGVRRRRRAARGRCGRAPRRRPGARCARARRSGRRRASRSSSLRARSRRSSQPTDQAPPIVTAKKTNSTGALALGDDEAGPEQGRADRSEPRSAGSAAGPGTLADEQHHRDEQRAPDAPARGRAMKIWSG